MIDPKSNLLELSGAMAAQIFGQFEHEIEALEIPLEPIVRGRFQELAADTALVAMYALAGGEGAAELPWIRATLEARRKLLFAALEIQVAGAYNRSVELVLAGVRSVIVTALGAV